MLSRSPIQAEQKELKTQMKNDTKIKVIKKNKIGKIKKPVVLKKDSRELTTRKIAAIVAVWIEEQKQTRFEDAKSAIESLNNSKPQTA